MSADNYESCLLEYRIHAEYQQLIKNRIPGVYVIPSANSSFIWYGVIFVHQGCYEGAVFRFTLFIPDNFECPRVIFNPIVYHPHINLDSGEFEIKQYIPNWKKNMHHVYHILYYAKRMFYQIDTNNAVNKEAAHLHDTNYDQFRANVRSCIDKCKNSLYESPPTNADDPHAIRFSDIDADAIKQVKQNMLNYLHYDTI